MATGAAYSDPAAILVGGLFLASAAGLWFRQDWSRRLCAAGFAFLAAYTGYMLHVRGYSLTRLVGCLVSAWSVWIIWNSDIKGESVDKGAADDADEDEEPLVSLVALLPELGFLDSSILAHIAGDAWGTTVGTDDDDNEMSFAVGESPHFVVKYDGWLFAVHHVGRPYFDDPEQTAAQSSESRICRAVLDHRAWLSVDLIGTETEEHVRPTGYRLIGRLLAELIEDDCLAICCPETQSIHPWHSSLAERLRGDDPLTDLREMVYPPVLSVDGDDPRMFSAVDEARRRWPEFITAFERRGCNQDFSVKAPLTDGAHTEFMWVNVTAVENDVIYGTLGNDPVEVKTRKLGDLVRVPLGDLNDWMYVDDDGMHGGFTIEVVKAMTAEPRRHHRDANNS